MTGNKKKSQQDYLSFWLKKNRYEMMITQKALNNEEKQQIAGF